MKGDRDCVTRLQGLPGPAVSHHDIRRMSFDGPMPGFTGFIHAVETDLTMWIGPYKVGDGHLDGRDLCEVIKVRPTIMGEHRDRKEKKTNALRQSGESLRVHAEILEERI